MKITLDGAPKSTNNIYRYACRGNHPCMYMSSDGKALKEAYQWEAKRQWKKQPWKSEIEVIIGLYFPTKGKHDWDNFHKLSMDALTGIVWEDDSQIIRSTVTKHYDKDRPRIEIDIYPV